MNKIYRLVWNKSLNLWTVVSENARGVTKKRNVSANTDVQASTLVQADLKQQKQYQPISTVLALTISSVLWSAGAFAATNTGGGSANNGTSMALSPTASQCGTGSGEASVSGPNGVAIGCGSTITGTDPTIQQGLVNRRGTGSNNYPTGIDRLSAASTSIGRNNKVSNPGGATVVGNSNVSDGSGTFQNVAIGQGNRTAGQGYNTALGIGNELTDGNSNVAIGVNNRAAGNTSIAMGRLSWADASYSFAAGNTATVAAGADGGLAMGHSATTKGVRGIAIGSSTSTAVNYDPATAANADGTDSVAVGTGAKGTGNQTTAVGRQAKATGANSSAYGNEANANGTSSVAVGDKAKAQGNNDIAMGLNAATASGGSNNIAVGNGVTTGATGQNVAMGSGTTTANSASSTGGAVAIGRDQKATGDGAVALGDPNTANGNGTVALGRNNTAAGDTAGNTAANGAVAIGNENQAIGQGAVALGNASKASAAGAIALGDTANAQASNGVALGSNAVATNANDVALGSGSQTSTATGAAYRTGTAAPSSVVSVGTAGNERRIQNVSAGAADTDAVNVSQLRSVQDGVDQLGQSTANALGGGSSYDPSTGAVSNPTYTVNGTNVNNVGAAITELDKGWNLQSNGANSGAVKAGDTVDIGTADGEENLQVAKEGNNIKYSLNRDLKVDSVTAGDTVINNDGMTIAGGPSVTKSGIDAAGNKISGVAAGTDGTDAVNVDQLNQASQDLTDKGFGLTAQDGTTVQKKLGEAVDVVGADSNISTKVQDGKVAIELAKDLNVDSVTAGDTVMNTDGVTIAGGPSMTKSGIDAAGNKITNVADGDINPDSKDAINGSQLANNAQSVSDALGGGSTVNPDGTVSAPTYTVNGTNVNNVGAAITELDKGWNLQSNGANSGAVKAGDTVDIGTADGEENLQVAKEGNNIKYSLNRDLKVDSVTAGDTVINNDGMTIAGGPSVTKSGIDAAGNKISGVAAGTDGTDAVNVDQLNQASQDLTDKGFGLTAQDGTTVQKKLGEAVDVVGADSNISTKVQDGKVAIELAKDLNVDSVTAGDTVMNTDGVTIAGGPSMTKSGIDAAGNKITNVADGDINPDSKDAINGSQLANNAQSVSDALGGGSTVNPDGTVSAPTYTVNGTNVNNVGAAITELDKGWNLQSNGANSGAVKAGDTVDIGTADGEENLQVAKEGNNIKYSLNRDLKVDSVTAGDTVINNDGMTIAGGPSVTKSGIDAAGNKISGVAAGTDGTDAVNVDQLNQASQDLTDKGFGLTAQDGTTVQKKLGEAVDVVGADSNISTKVQDGKVAIELAKDLNVDSVTAGDTVMNTDGVTIAGGPSMTKSGIDAAGNKITNVADGDINPDSKDAINGSQLANNAQSVSDALGGGSTVNPDGTVSAPTYTVNGTNVNNVGAAITELDKGWNLQSNGANSGAVKAGDTVDIGTADGEENLQVAKEGNNIKYSLNRDLKVDSVTAGDTVVNNDGMTIAGGPSVTKSGIDAAGNKITNVAAGTEGTDAVNMDQLKTSAAGAKTEVEAGKNMTVDSTTGADGQTIYTVATADDVEFNSVKVGDVNIDGTTGKISGVTDGTVAAGSTEAVNGSQLHGTAQSVSDALGGGSTVNPDGTVTAPNYSVNGTSLNNVGDAITELDKGWNLQSNGANSGAVKAGDTVDIGTADGEENLQVAKEGNNIKYSLNRNLKVDSVTAGDTVINNDGMTIAGGPSVTKSGVDAAGNKITNVADGDINPDSKDAINGSQLANNAQSVSDALGGGSTVNPDGTVSAPNYSVNGTSLNNVGDAITELDKGWNLQSNGANSGAVKAGDTVDIGTADGEENLQVAKEGNNIKYSLNRDLKVDSVTAGDTVLNNDGMTIAGGPSVTKSGIDAAGNKISGVAAGTEGTDAVNVDQLKASAAGAKTEVEAGKNMTVDSTTGADGQTIYTVSTADDVEFNSVKVGDVNIDGATGKISGVTDGTVAAGSTEAVNGSQLHGTAQSVSDALGGGSTVNPDGTVTAPNYTVNGNNVSNVGDAITELDKGWNLQSNGANSGAVKAGDTVDIGTAEGEENLQVAKDGNNIKYSLNRDLKVDSVTAGDTVINNDGMTIAGGPSVTKAGINAGNNKITGVAPGTVSADSTDAINGSQLHAQGEGVKNIIGGNTQYDPDTGTYTNPDIGGTGQNNINDAIGSIGKAAAAAKTEVEAGKNMTVESATGADGQTIYTVATADDVEFNTVKVGDVNIDGSTGKISGVAAGDVNPDSTDAVNGSQLANNAQSVADALGGGSTVNPDGTISTPNYTVNGNNVSNVGDAITELDKGWNLQSNGANAGAVKAGDTVDIGTADGEENLQVAKKGNTIKYSLSRDLNVDSVTAGDTLINTDGMTISGGPSVTKAGISAGNKKITNVAPGTVSADSTDAINGSQLHAQGEGVKNIIGGNTQYDPNTGKYTNPDIGGTGKDNINDAIGAVGDAAKAAKSTVSNKDGNITVNETTKPDGSRDYEVGLAKDIKVDSVTAGGTKVDGDGLHIDGGPSVTKDGIDAGDKKVTGVADGTVAKDSKDAVNGGQLRGVSDSVAGAIGGNTTVNPDGTITTSNIGDTGYNNINDAIKSVKQDAQAAKTSVSNTDNNLTINKTTKTDGSTDYEVGLADKIKVKQVDADQVNVAGDQGKTSISGGGISITGPKGEQGPSMTTSGINAGGKKVTGVADGAIAKDSKDAINGSQLHQSYQDVGAALGGGASYDPSKGWTGPSYEIGGTKHDNVGDALGALDNADKALGDRITNLGDQMQQAFYDTNQRIDDVKKLANAGVAAAMALETAPYISGKYTYAVGAAYHGGENAVGVTLRKTADNGRWSLTTGVAAASQGDPSFRVGLSGVFD